MVEKVIKVPTVEGPRSQLCFETSHEVYDANNMTHCDRVKGHGGLHSWEMAAQGAALAAENARLSQRINEIVDIPLAQRQLPDGTVPGNTVECAHGWHKAYDDLWTRERDLRAALQQAREQLAEPSEAAPDRLKLNAYGRRCYDAGAKAVAADRDRLQRHWDALRAWLQRGIDMRHPGSEPNVMLTVALAHLDHLAGKEQANG